MSEPTLYDEYVAAMHDMGLEPISRDEFEQIPETEAREIVQSIVDEDLKSHSGHNGKGVYRIEIDDGKDRYVFEVAAAALRDIEVLRKLIAEELDSYHRSAPAKVSLPGIDSTELEAVLEELKTLQEDGDGREPRFGLEQCESAVDGWAGELKRQLRAAFRERQRAALNGGH